MTQIANEKTGWTITKTKEDGLSREYKVIVAKQILTERVQSSLGEIASQAQLPGFRAGKVPVALIEKRYGGAVLSEVLEKLSREALQKLFTDEKIQPVTMPRINYDTYEKEKDFSFSVATEVFPEIEIADLSAYTLERPKVEASAEHIEETLKGMLSQLVDSDSKVAGDGHTLHGSVQAYDQDGKETAQKVGRDNTIYVNINNNKQAFEVLKGINVGETRKLKYPELMNQYGVPELGFTLTEILEVKETAASDAEAEKQGYRDLADWKSEIKASIEAQYEKQTRNIVHSQILKRLEETHQFTLPASLVNQEVHGLILDAFSAKAIDVKPVAHTHEDGSTCDHDHANDHQHPEQQKKAFDAIRKQAEEVLSKVELTKIDQRAAKRVKLALIISKLCQKHEIQVSEGELRVAINKLARENPQSAKFITELYEKNVQMREELRAPLVEKKALDFVMSMAKVEEKAMKFDDYKTWVESKAKENESEEV